MKVLLKDVFSIVDGRLSTNIDKVYEMLNYVFNANLFTHELPMAMDKLKATSPPWYKEAKSVLEAIKTKADTDNFGILMSILEAEFSEYYIELGSI